MKNPNNKLLHQKSPYLQQHRDNPVNWYPWGDEAFAKARQEKKPIFLSIGYSSCHWCHVMEKECFQDEDVAKVLNEKFVSIKVDREERPDVDSVYMLVCQMMTGHGGWPLTLFMNANKDAFFAGTYFPKLSQPGRLGFLDLLKRIDYVWHNQTKDLHATIQNIRHALQESQKISGDSKGLVPQDLITQAFEELQQAFDPHRGGFGLKPKFPSPHKLLFLQQLLNPSLPHSQNAKSMIEKTLLEMHRGGIWDHIRGGFHRYSTDEHWELPHFEKMLYDQALCTMAYLDGYQATRNPLFGWVAERSLDFVLQNLQAPEGGFYSAYDADSEGEEGAFYVWSFEELQAALTESELKELQLFYDLKEDGNYLDEATHEKTGKNILFLKNFVTPQAFLNYQNLNPIFDKLKQKADQRPHPFLDRKILLDWNALLGVTLLKASEVLGEVRYLKAAERMLGFLQDNMMAQKSLFHSSCEGEVLKIGFLDDYASYIWFLIEFYKQTQNEDYLLQADDMFQEASSRFWDASSSSFYLSSQAELAVRTKDFYDGAYPSGNSLMIYNAVLLWQLTEQKKYEKIIQSFFEKNATLFASAASSFSFLMKAFQEWIQGALEIQIVGNWSQKQRSEIESMLREFYLPGKILKNIEGDTPQILVCRNQTCSLPVSTLEDLHKLLKSHS